MFRGFDERVRDLTLNHNTHFGQDKQSSWSPSSVACVMTRRSALAAISLFAMGCTKVTNTAKHEKAKDRKSEVDVANEDFLNGDYRAALAKYTGLASRQPEEHEFKLAIAYCYANLGDFDQASRAIAKVQAETLDDTRFCAFVHAKADNFPAAGRAMSQLSDDSISNDVELFEAIASAAARAEDRSEAWKYLRQIQKHDPSSPAIDRLTESGRFNFTYEFFSYGPRSLWRYTKGFGSGVLGWTVDTVNSLWHLVRHPIDSVKSMAYGIKRICSRENLELLLSPKRLTSALGSVIARQYWSAWEACKLSAAREFDLNADLYQDQQAIHEIAAGRMFGYVAPDLVVLILSAGAGSAVKATEAAEAAESIGAVAKTAETANACLQTEERVQKVNQIGRSATFISDAENFPRLCNVYWLTEDTWEAIKTCPRVTSRMESFVEWMSIVRDVPGAERLVKTIASRRQLADVEGYVFQLERAAAYAKDDKLAEIGHRFTVTVRQTGRPVKVMIGDADLVLKDGTLVETKFRNGALALGEKEHVQLLKYDRAVKEGKFKKILVDCNGRVGQSFRERCETISDGGAVIEIIENTSIKPLSVANIEVTGALSVPAMDPAR